MDPSTPCSILSTACRTAFVRPHASQHSTDRRGMAHVADGRSIRCTPAPIQEPALPFSSTRPYLAKSWGQASVRRAFRKSPLKDDHSQPPPLFLRRCSGRPSPQPRSSCYALIFRACESARPRGGRFIRLWLRSS